MELLEDELDLRYHKGFEPDVYYRCPTLESLAGALRNEVDKNACSFIPTHIVTEFVFAASSTITIPVTQQPNLDVLIEPADYLQSIAVEHVLCQDINGRERLKVQRAIARSIVAAMQETDGFEYLERSAQNRDGGDGARFRFVCRDSVQNRYRKSSIKKDVSHDSDGSDVDAGKNGHGMLPTYDCGGAIHIKFSLKRKAINVVYKHNPIHTTHPAGANSLVPPVPTMQNDVAPPAYAAHGERPQKRRRSKEAEAEVENQHRDSRPEMPNSPALKSSAKKRKKEGAKTSPKPARTASSKQSTKAKSLTSSTQSQEKTFIDQQSTSLLPATSRACLRCREKKIKCNRAEPTCDQCRRGLWTCQYNIAVKKKSRSRNGCLNCKQRERKCTQEKPSCAHCLRTDANCEYADHSSVL